MDHHQQHNLNAVLINGSWHQIEGAQLQLSDPASGQCNGALTIAGESVVAAAVGAARRSFAETRPGLADRLLWLRALHARISEEHEAFARCISSEIGAPIDFARNSQVNTALVHLHATITALETDQPDQPLTNNPNHRVRHEALGVAALITPWNWPLNQTVLKVAGALAAGCSMVLKPSELSSRTAVMLARAIQDCGVPDGVFNLILGDGHTGAALAAHPDIDVISFTGSTETGCSIAAAAAQTHARTLLELGGKSANILFEDCPLEQALTQGLAHCFRNAGQSCNAASRMLVARPIYDQACKLAEQIAADTPLGRPNAPGKHLGPQVSLAQFERVQRYIALGLDEGLRLLAGGAGRPTGFEQGYYTRPTVFADVPPESRLFQEEIFGPVLCLTPFDSEEEAVTLANMTGYGLSGYIQTHDPARADRVAQALRVGVVQINGTSRESGAPFGGRGLSGHGRESGLWGIRAFQDVKSISGAPYVDMG